jgi:hypothetical protein
MSGKAGANLISIRNTIETVKLITDFNDWLMANDPAPESVAEIRLYWQTKRKELADKVIANYIKGLEG